SKEKITKAMSMGNVPTTAGVANYNNIKQYNTQLRETERIMRSKVPNGGGIFATTQFKDAQGNMTGFLSTLKQVDGTTERIRYKWNAQAGQFTPISRQSVVATQNNVTAMKKAIYDL